MIGSLADFFNDVKLLNREKASEDTTDNGGVNLLCHRKVRENKGEK